MKDLAFILRVFKAFDDWCGADKDSLFWRTDGEYAPISFFVNCNDLFYWGTADTEDLTPENIGILEQTTVDCRAVDPVIGCLRATDLFCCRIRRERMQGACYQHLDQKYWPLFDACGPVREVNMVNPRQHPSED